MSRELWLELGSLIVTGVIGVSCATNVQQKSTGTNWIECKVDADCKAFPEARCGNTEVCVDANGKAISGAPDGGAGTGGSDGVSAFPADCFSPGQNLDHAYDEAAVGCRCRAAESSVCVKAGEAAVALGCDWATGNTQFVTRGRWFPVQDGACSACWSPDQPDLALAMPSQGCACAVEDGSNCFHTMASGYMRALCSGGKWTIDPTMPVTCDTCDSDARCGFGGKCTNGHCSSSGCEVYGVKYALGAGNIPDPFSCNTCSCGALGTLECTKLACPIACPEGTVEGTVCLACGPVGGCDSQRIGCVPRCDSSSECPASGPLCNTTTHACTEAAGCL